MSKKSKAVVGYDHITPQLLDRVKAVIEEADKHKYSISRVYAAHNAVFKKNDIPQACSSCLRNRVRELRMWLKGAPEDLVHSGADGVQTEPPRINEEKGPEEEPQYDDPGAPGFVEPAEGVIRYPMGEGHIPFDFTPSVENMNKGTVVSADGSRIKAGSYTTAIGHVIAVQPGGKASIKIVPEEDLT